jgi:beta-galactosidase/beta-glucuronidase
LILKNFGNHPSFVMFTLGNELGRNKGMFELVAHFKELDPRHLYAQGSNNMHWNPSLAEGDDFWVTGKVGKTSARCAARSTSTTTATVPSTPSRPARSMTSATRSRACRSR